ncbi:MAG: putative RNA uridine N3 methyltransferase, partial [Thermoprotei archaeon]
YLPLQPVLRYAGVAPPIKGPLHTVASSPERALNESFRMALVVSAGDGAAASVDAGFGSPLAASIRPGRAKGERVLVRIRRLNRGYVAEEVSGTDLFVGTEPQLVDDRNLTWIPASTVTVELTRNGRPVSEAASRICGRDVLAFVGSQSRDPHEFLELKFDLKLNLVACQGVESIRADEAAVIGLACISSLCAEHEP